MKKRSVIVAAVLLILSACTAAVDPANEPTPSPTLPPEGTTLPSPTLLGENPIPDSPEPDEPPTVISETVWTDPDGYEFARGLGYSFEVLPDDFGTQITQYWESGEKRVKFQKVVDGEGTAVIYINDQPMDFSFFFQLDYICPAGDFIVTADVGTDVRSTRLYIMDYSGRVLMKVYYLNNKGMVIDGGISVEGNEITMRGSRFDHGLSLVMGNPFEDQYAEYWYMDTIYEYDYEDLPYYEYLMEVSLENPETAEKLNPEEIVRADFVMEYLGGGQFATIQMAGNILTLGKFSEEYWH